MAGWLIVVGLGLCGACRLWPDWDIPAGHSADTIVRGQLVFYADFVLPRRHRLIDELVALQTDVTDRLLLPPSDEPIHVYLFRDPDQFRHFLSRRYPQVPDRRAFFVETDTRLAVFAHWGDRVAEDLRHELAHGSCMRWCEACRCGLTKA